jgi:hypothetical protein
VAYELVWEPRGIYRRYFGRLSGRDLIDSHVVTQADPRFDGLRYALNDLSGVDSVDVHDDDLTHVVAAQHGAFHSNPNVIVAMVIPSPAILAEFRRFEQAGSTPYRFDVFASLDEARAFLARDDGRRILRDRAR